VKQWMRAYQFRAAAVATANSLGRLLLLLLLLLLSAIP
jgi:hypothetical protein